MQSVTKLACETLKTFKAGKDCIVSVRKIYLLSWFLLEPDWCFPASTAGWFFASTECFSIWSLWDNFNLLCISSTCLRHNDSLSFLGIFVYLTSAFKRCFAVDHDVKTVLPSSLSFRAASAVMTSASKALKSRVQRWQAKDSGLLSIKLCDTNQWLHN